MTKEEKKICPNCGTPMKRYGRIWHCPNCCHQEVIEEGEEPELRNILQQLRGAYLLNIYPEEEENTFIFQFSNEMAIQVKVTDLGDDK